MALLGLVDLPVSDEEEWEDGESEEDEEKVGSRKKAKVHAKQLKRLQEKVRLRPRRLLRFAHPSPKLILLTINTCY